MNRSSPASLLAVFALTFALIGSASVFADVPPTRLGLSDLYATTVEGSDRVRTRSAEKLQVEEVKSQGNSAFLPQISGVATYLKSDQPGLTLGSGGGTGGTGGSNSAASFSDTQKTLKLTGKEYLFNGGREYAYLSRTNRLLEAKDAQLAGSRQQYYLDLANAYYDTLLKQAEVVHATTELRLYDEQITELRSRVSIGRSRSSDLLTAEASRAGSAGTLRAAESALSTSRLNLANVARIAPNFELREESPSETPLATLEEYIQLGGQRPDLIAARKNRDAASEDIAYQRGGHFPTVDLTGNYYVHREGVANPSKWDATVTLAVPIFSGGLTQSAVRQSAAVLLATEVETGRLERTNQSDIRALYQNLLNSEIELKAFREAVELAQKSYDQTRKDYRYGLTTNLDLLNSLKTLTEAKRNYDQAKYRHFLERIQIEVAAGRIPPTRAT
ncbi:MAG: TolC family protein [Cryobacterium sp.]|nr:TolC family protein [Oligoflexia bacterium]